MLYQSNTRERQVRRVPGEVQGAAMAAVSSGGARCSGPQTTRRATAGTGMLNLCRCFLPLKRQRACKMCRFYTWKSNVVKGILFSLGI